MRRFITWRRGVATVLASVAAGTAFAGGCTNAQMQAAAAALDVILRNFQEEDDISFGDWLSSELDD